MQIVRCETKSQLQTLIKKTLFRPYHETDGNPEETVLTPEQVCEALGIDPESLLEERENVDPDLFDDNLAMSEVENHVLVCDGIPMLRDFKPGVLAFHIEDSFDRMGSTEHHSFHYVKDADLTFAKWQQGYNKIQQDYAEKNARRAAVEQDRFDRG
ncbi:hypothetical protein D3C85_770490 [compost metagenome]